MACGLCSVIINDFWPLDSVSLKFYLAISKPHSHEILPGIVSKGANVYVWQPSSAPWESEAMRKYGLECTAECIWAYYFAAGLPVGVVLLHIMTLGPEFMANFLILILPKSFDMLICKMSYRKSYFQRLLLMVFGANWVTGTISSLSCCEIPSILHQSELLTTGIIQEIHRIICCMTLDKLSFLKI